ncbi:hypothetical protein WJ0W_001403 [Paenibacillus melissococcoides]|uniref:Uncharacterized protein n=1 Tax=Paenibacillus melissococcoides TaxID=2912268 RepID=A0ABM9FY72_9BACL|nr:MULTISPECIES: hypothetical protein [Paenibacillus]MEB9893689.1 hypothetical protein [Bacillus cereus]CAH8244165.1 hypothetical protein WJ0W_001403 [Paenibacillus melissococcoides]CAH8703739.1 hypothetical protein HTL2_000260 [Paenibacillus melissococcoides]CAH8706263.1 hypothetical protein WDD9_001222 [Paenibacillus melissococcoides]
MYTVEGDAILYDVNTEIKSESTGEKNTAGVVLAGLLFFVEIKHIR